MNSYGLQTPVSGNIGGILPVQNNAALNAAEDARRQAERENNQPIIQSLAAHVRKCWTQAYTAKQQTVEPRMLQSVRQRRGEYDPETLGEIRKTGGSEIYMMLTSNKCRAASSWLRDVLTGTGNDKPWGIDPTPVPTLNPTDMEGVAAEASQEAMAIEQAMGAQITTPYQMKEIVNRISDRRTAEAMTDARMYASRMENKMEDQLDQGNFMDALSDFTDDLTTFPSAVLKGPVVRNKPRMQWVQNGKDWTPDVKNEIVLEWERVDPFMIYPAPHATDINDGYLIERHRLNRSDLVDLIGVDGYSENAIRAVLEQYNKGGLHEWLRVDTQKALAEGKSTSAISQNDERIDALQYWGSVQGRWLVEWGMDKKDVPDLDKEYNCEIWLIGQWIIKATLNYDPFGRKPYYKTSYEEIPGVFWGNSVADLVRDCQNVCNSAARALVNNMGISSGPQVSVNVDRIPAGEDVTQMYPWKIWQTVNDPFGSSAQPVSFFQPSSLAQELMVIHNTFSGLADEYSGVPRYMTGDSPAGGAGRTASGMSMLMNNASKAMKQVVNNIDQFIMRPLIERLYYYNMKYGKDPELKGDVNIIARGANAMIQKEGAQQRRNEFLQIVASNPTFSQLVGMQGIAALLRETAKTLDMDTDKLVPSDEAIRAMQFQQSQQTMIQQGLAAQQGQQPQQMPQPQQQPQQPQGPIAQNGQTLMNGQPITDQFQPNRQPG
jgi:hypothetical protein